MTVGWPASLLVLQIYNITIATSWTCCYLFSLSCFGNCSRMEAGSMTVELDLQTASACFPDNGYKLVPHCWCNVFCSMAKSLLLLFEINLSFKVFNHKAPKIYPDWPIWEGASTQKRAQAELHGCIKSSRNPGRTPGWYPSISKELRSVSQLWGKKAFDGISDD